jgi:hypothetical protein
VQYKVKGGHDTVEIGIQSELGINPVVISNSCLYIVELYVGLIFDY